MLREMASGEPVRMTVSGWSWKRLARLAFIAEQFGYQYADLQMTSDNKFALFIAPDPSPEGRQRAAQNRAQYPDADEGVALPPGVPDTIDLLKARMVVDTGSQHSQRRPPGARSHCPKSSGANRSCHSPFQILHPAVSW